MANQVTAKQYLLQLNLIYGAQAFFMIVFGVVAIAVSESTQHVEDSFASLLNYILVAAVIASLTGAHFLFNQLLQRMDRNLTLRNKLQKYLSAVLIRSALLEFPGLFASVVCILTGSRLPLMAVLLIAIVFFLLRPTTTQITRDLSLSQQEKGILEDPNSLLGD